MRAYTIVDPTTQPVPNAASTLQPITTISGVIYNNYACVLRLHWLLFCRLFPDGVVTTSCHKTPGQLLSASAACGMPARTCQHLCQYAAGVVPLQLPSTALPPLTTCLLCACVCVHRYNDPRLASASARPTATWPAMTPAYLQTQLDLVGPCSSAVHLKHPHRRPQGLCASMFTAQLPCAVHCSAVSRSCLRITTKQPEAPHNLILIQVVLCTMHMCICCCRCRCLLCLCRTCTASSTPRPQIFPDCCPRQTHGGARPARPCPSCLHQRPWHQRLWHQHQHQQCQPPQCRHPRCQHPHPQCLQCRHSRSQRHTQHPPPGGRGLGSR